jgi:hypothetical protein
MTDSLTTLTAKVLALLLDDATRYSVATTTAAMRQTLKEWNDVAPRQDATLVPVVAGQLEYELDDPDFNSIIKILNVQLADSTGGDNDTELSFVEYWDDNRPWIRLKQALASGNLIVRFTSPNTINGLDSATESTIPAIFDQVLANGAAYYSIVIRSTGRVEPINLNANVPASLRDAAGSFYVSFLNGRSEAAKRNARPARLDPTWTYNPAGY